LRSYINHPGDGRLFPEIPARTLLWPILLGHILRKPTFHAIETLVRSSARAAMNASRAFCDDSLSYFVERLHPDQTRTALYQLVRQAKRNKAFDTSRFIGLAFDGTEAGKSRRKKCAWCRPHRNKKKDITHYGHSCVCASVVGVHLSLPVDCEPYGPGDSEYAAGLRLLARVVRALGKRFADYIVVDGKFATAPFLHAADQAGVYVVARLKDNLPGLVAAVKKRFDGRPPHKVYTVGNDRVEVWDADNFEPWETLRWKSVRVLRYRQHKPDGSVVEAEWLTNFPTQRAGSLAVFQMCKSRWEIENQGFNDAKNRYGFEHVTHHHENGVLIGWLLTLLAIVIERLFRVRHLHRGTHPVHTADALCLLLWLSLGRSAAMNSS
jgi:hypothetical protein